MRVLGFLGTPWRARAQPDEPADNAVSHAYLDRLAQRLDLLLAERGDEVPEGDDPITRRLGQLAARQRERAMNGLRRSVEMSVASNEAVFEMASIIPQARAVDARTHAISSAVEELSTAVADITEHSQTAAHAMANVAGTAAEGVRAADNAAETMNGLVSSVENTADEVRQLADASERIGEIVQQIQDIADKTNLLALNATIEAARAGEAGKGFAVVAGEVKSLATQTRTATETIRARIGQLQDDIQRIVGAMQDSSEKVRQGQETVTATSTEMNHVSDSVAGVQERLNHVAAILDQQRGASNEIAQNIGTIAEMSEHNLRDIENAIQRLEGGEAEIEHGIEDVLGRVPERALVYAAKSDHMVWMRKLSEMLAGRARLDERELSDHHQCRLGRWYDAQTDPALTNHPAWRALKAPHERVHAAGIEAAKRYNAGDLDGAAEKVNEADTASREVVAHLDRLIATFDADAGDGRDSGAG